MELLRGIYHAKLPLQDMILCYAEVGRFIAWRHGLRGIKQKIRNRLRRLDPSSQASPSVKPDSGAP